jgi:hypothetical protein
MSMIAFLPVVFFIGDVVHTVDELALHRFVGIHRVQAGCVETGVSNMSRTITIFNGSFASLNRFASLRRFSLLPMCRCHSGPSSALPVITTFTTKALPSPDPHFT